MERVVMKMLTLFSLEQYMNANKKSIFDDIVLPTSPLIDKDTLTDKILLDCGEFEPLYSNADFMAFATRNFFKVHARTIDKWVKALEVEYEPLENYNRTEVETYGAEENNVAEVHTTVDGLKKTTETSETVTRETVQGEVTTTSYDGETTETQYQGKVTTTSYDGETTEQKHLGKVTTTVTPPDTQSVIDYAQPFNYVSDNAYDNIVQNKTVTKISDSTNPTPATVTVVQEDPLDDDLITRKGDSTKPNVSEVQGDNTDKSEIKRSGDSTKPNVSTIDGNSSKPTTETTTGSLLNPHTITTGHEQGENDETTIVKNPRELHAYGNIGVTTSQQMLESELELQRFNLYQQITDLYLTEMVIPVYA